MAIIYVNSGATGLNNGTSWVDAYTSLTTAVENTVDRDEVWFTFDTPVSEDLHDHITHNILVHGGFHGTETTSEEREHWVYVNNAKYIVRLFHS